MLNFKEYIKERSGREVIESDKGFVTYGVDCLGLPQKHVYIEDIYVKPEFRKSSEATKLADKVCELSKDIGCSIVVGSVSVPSNQADSSLKVLIAYGMKLLTISNNTLYMYKEL